MSFVAVGSAWDGIQLVGPFDDPDAATAWAERNAFDVEWCVVSPKAPENF